MLTAEACRVEFKKGVAVRTWIPTRPRNEALDCRVLSLAALYHLNPNWQKVEKGIAKRLEMVKVATDKVSTNGDAQEVQESAPQTPKAPVRRVPRRGFVSNWRRY